MRKKALLLILLTTPFIITACGNEDGSVGENNESGNKNGKTTVYTTAYPLQFFTETIGGDTVNVESILPPGSDAHTFEPTTKEMVEMAEADLFIYNGAGMESYAGKISESIEPEGVSILEASSSIDLKEHVHDHGEEKADEEGEHDHKEGEGGQGEDSHEGHNHGEQDPHVWLDPVRAAQLAENIKGRLIEMNPENEDMYEENFKELESNLTTLDESFHEQVETKEKSEIIVSHAAYGYWEEAYGIEQIAVSGLSPTNEPSQKDLENIIQLAEEHDLEYVIFEQNITPKISEVIQKEIGAEPLRFHNLSVLTESNIENDEDYFSLMEQNRDVLAQALTE